MHLNYTDTIHIIVTGRPSHFFDYRLQIDTNPNFPSYSNIREGISSIYDTILILYVNDYFIDTTRSNYWLRIRSVDSSNNISPFSFVNILHVTH